MTTLNVVTSANNFARGQVDHDLNGRYDLPIYQTGAKAFENFISNFKGNAIFRTGYERMLDFQDSGFMEFRFSLNQNYLLALYNLKMRFASYAAGNVFGWVLDGGSNILEVDTPYSLADSKNITGRKAYTQNFDSIIVTHKNYEPRELKRLSANSFRFTTFSRKSDPFPKTWAATQNITGVTKATEAVITINAHGLAVNDRFKIAAVGGMVELNDWTAAVIGVVDANNVRVDIDTTPFTAYSGGGTGAKVLTGDYPNVCVYYKNRLWFGGTTLKPTTVWASEVGQFKVFTLPTGTPLAESALQFTVAELDSQIEWMYRGQNSLILGTNNDIAAINGGDGGTAITAETVDSVITDADGTSTTEPLAKDSLIFYITNDGRRMNFFSYDLLSETFGAENANVVAYDITLGGVKKIRYVKNREDLIFGTRGDGRLLTCNFNKAEKIIGWHNHPSEAFVQDIASIADNDGVQQLFALNIYNGSYYIERQAPYIEFAQRKDFFTVPASDEPTRAEWDAVRDADDEAWYRKVAEQLKQAVHLDNANILQDLRTATITYDANTGRITASAPSFTDPNSVGRHISYRTKTGYESGRFLITNFISTTVVEVEVLQAPTTTVYDSWYMSFNTVPSMGRFTGQEVKVVADGGFLDDFTVSGTTIPLDQEVTSVVVGYGYKGFIESFALGFSVQGENTQDTMKVIDRVGLRCCDTSGGAFGTTRYRLDPVQKLRQGDLNYLPPKPINETVFVDYADDHTVDKSFIIAQDVPLPMTVTAAFVDASYAVTR